MTIDAQRKDRNLSYSPQLFRIKLKSLKNSFLVGTYL